MPQIFSQPSWLQHSALLPSLVSMISFGNTYRDVIMIHNAINALTTGGFEPMAEFGFVICIVWAGAVQMLTIRYPVRK